MTPSQLKALRWLDENQSHRARWLDKHGRQARGDSETWTHFEIAGHGGSIKITSADMKALSPYLRSCPSPDKIYGITETARAALGVTP